MDLDLDFETLPPVAEAAIGDAPAREADALREELHEARLEARHLAAELAKSRASQSLLFATLDAADDGFVAFEFGSDTQIYNTAFVKMWRLPQDMMPTLRRDELIALQCVQAKRPDDLLEQSSAFDPEAETFDV